MVRGCVLGTIPAVRPTTHRRGTLSRTGSMTTMTVDRRRLFAALAGSLIGLFFVLAGPAGPASAHAALVASDPANGTIVPDAPNKVTLTFSESVQLISGKKIGRASCRGRRERWEVGG